MAKDDGELDRALAAAVAEHFEHDQVPFLAQLVGQPSCSREAEDVERAARLVDVLARQLGLAQQTHVDPSGSYAPHRVYETERVEEDTVAIALCGHVDTVFPRALGFLGFERDGDVARGPGVLDMKSGLSSIFFALAAIRSAAPELYARLAVRVVMDSDEEVGSPTSRPLLEALAVKTRAALVFEAGRAEDAIIVARKGTGSFTVVARGKGSHAGLAHGEGVNAIDALARVIPPLSELTDHARGVTVNVGLIEGGTSKNTVPERASCGVDVRHVAPEDGPRLERDMRRVLEETALPERLASVRFEMDGRFHRPPMVATEANRALMGAYAREARAVGLGHGEAPLQGGGSDANILAAAGVPCIDGLGPRGRGVHQTSEECSLESLRRRTEALARFLVREAAD